MKTYLSSLLAILVLTGIALADMPVDSARNHLEKVRTLLERPNVKTKQEAGVENKIANHLSLALTNLEGARKNRGSYVPLAIKAVKSAQEEIAKGSSAENQAKALEFVKVAIKQADKAFDTRR